MIILSAGHNKDAVGARHGEYSEYPYTRQWCEKILDYIVEADEDCALVTSGTLPEKVKRVNECVGLNNHDIDLAVELHFNSAVGANGCETLYYPGSRKGKILAVTFNNYLMKQCPVLGKNRGAKEGWYKMDRPGIRDWDGDQDGDEMPDYFLRKTNCPALILEPIFIQEMEKFIKYENLICKSIAESLIVTKNVLKKILNK